jgi:hypothetical protein
MLDEFQTGIVADYDLDPEMEVISEHDSEELAAAACAQYAESSGIPEFGAVREDFQMRKNCNEKFDLNEHGDFFAVEVECDEGDQYVCYYGTYRNIEGQEFPGATLEVFLMEPVQLDADGDIVIPSAWENFWVLGHELP